MLARKQSGVRCAEHEAMGSSQRDRGRPTQAPLARRWLPQNNVDFIAGRTQDMALERWVKYNNMEHISDVGKVIDKLRRVSNYASQPDVTVCRLPDLKTDCYLGASYDTLLFLTCSEEKIVLEVQ